MAIFEIINPSDPYSLETGEWAVACLAAPVLGHGQYALHEIGGEGRLMPIFIFGGADEWFKKQFGKTIEQLIDVVPRPAIADCLDSMLIGSARDRQSFHEALTFIDDPEKKRQYWEQWHESHRSSLNDIGGRARKMAAALRKAEAKR